jgi:hypothetical protein
MDPNLSAIADHKRIQNRSGRRPPINRRSMLRNAPRIVARKPRLARQPLDRLAIDGVRPPQLSPLLHSNHFQPPPRRRRQRRGSAPPRTSPPTGRGGQSSSGGRARWPAPLCVAHVAHVALGAYLVREASARSRACFRLTRLPAVMYRPEALRAFLRRHTSDTLSMSNPVHGRATATSADHVRSAKSQGLEPRNPSTRGALHGRYKAYHGSALPTELRGRGGPQRSAIPRPG